MFSPKIDASKVDVGISLGLDTENKLELVLSVFNYGMSLGNGTSVSFGIPSALTLVNTIPDKGCSGASYDQTKALLTIPSLGSGQECSVRFVVTNPQNVKTISATASLLESRDVNVRNNKVWPTFDLESNKGSDTGNFITNTLATPSAPQGAALSTESSQAVNTVTCTHTEDSYSPTTFTCSDGTTLTGHCVIESNPRCYLTAGFTLVDDTWTSAQRGRVQYLIDNNCVNSNDLWGVLGQTSCASTCCTDAVAAFPTGSTSTAGPFQLLHTDNGRVYPVNDGAACQDFLVYPQPAAPCTTPITSASVTDVYSDYGTSYFDAQSSYPGFCTGFHEDTPVLGETFSVITDPSTIPFNNSALTNAEIRDKIARTLAVMQHPQFAPSPLPTGLNSSFYRIISDVIWNYTDNEGLNTGETWVGTDGNTYDKADLLNWVDTNVLQPASAVFLMPAANTTQIEVIINPCPTCALSLTATPTTCTSNTYSVSGQFTFANAPTSGTLTATVGSSSSTPITMTNAIASPQNFTITGLTADGLSKTVNASFSADATCTGSINYTAPSSCVSTCTINTPTVTSTCNNNGTASDPSDDTFSFTIQTTGTNTGANYKVEKTNPSPTSTVFASVTYGSTSAASSAFAISGGNLTLKLTDNTTSTCALSPVTVPAPATCSSTAACSFTATNTTPVCNDNGTSNITTDDTYTFNVTATSVSGTSATGYSANDPLSTMGTYGAAKSFGSYSISGNPTLNITLTDKATGSCTFALPAITAPSPCSTPTSGGQPDLELTKTADKTSARTGDTLTYTVTLRNTGTGVATGVKVKDLIPTGLTYGSSVPSQGTYASATGVWDVGSVAIGATLTLTITVTVN